MTSVGATSARANLYRRIDIQHRLVYEVDPDEGIVHVLRMWTHDE